MSDITQLIEPEVQLEQVGGGLISKEFFEYNLASVHEYARAKQQEFLMKNLRFKHSEYVPLYSIGFQLDPHLPVTAIVHKSFEVGSYEKLMAAKQGLDCWQTNTVYSQFLQKCIEREAYNILLFNNHKTNSKLTSKEALQQSVIGSFSQFVDKPVDLRIYREGRNTARNYVDIIQNVKYYCDWSKSRTRRAKPEDPIIHFLTNFYYMAKLNEHNSVFWLEPMFSLMVKKEYIAFVRACMMTNTPIPVELLELWIDEKLDKTDSEYKIRPTFVKYIKTPFREAGVRVVVHENLFDIMYEKPALPKHRNVAERNSWVNELSVRLLDIERREKGIITNDMLVTPSSASTEVITPTRNSEVEEQQSAFERLVMELSA